MAYTHSYINKLDQFGYVNYTLVLRDEDGIMPTIVNDKSFSKEVFPDLGQEVLEQEAQNDISIYTQQYEDEIAYNELLEQEQLQNEEEHQALMSELENAIRSNDPQQILDSMYSILKNNDFELSESIKSAVDKLEDSSVIEAIAVDELVDVKK